MSKIQSDKKIFLKKLKRHKSVSSLSNFVATYKHLFQVARHNRVEVASQYIKGLLCLEKGKANMERMEEEIPDSEYRMYQHFLSNSNWDHKEVLSKVSLDTSGLMEGNKKKSKRPTGLIVDELVENGVKFDWIGGDGLYGHNRELRRGLDQRGLFFVLDVHKDEKVFLDYPTFSIPPKSGKQGKPIKQKVPNVSPVRLDKYIKGIEKDEWSEETKLRKIHKGWKKVKVHIKKIWVLESKDNQVEERTLIITQSLKGKKETKYSISNGTIDQYSAKEYAYFQAQRYWVERTFDDAKN